MNDSASRNILKKTFEYLEEVLEEQNHQNKTDIDERLKEKESSSDKDKNKPSGTVQGDCCST